MAVRGYVLIETDVGKAKAVGEAISEIKSERCRVTAVDTVTGPYDVIVQLQADDLDWMSNSIQKLIQKVPGVQRTTTCLAVRLA